MVISFDSRHMVIKDHAEMLITLIEEIRSILMNDWDPIGVKNYPEAHDEYDLYVTDIVNMLRTGATETDITDYLHWAIHVYMGFPKKLFFDNLSSNACSKILQSWNAWKESEYPEAPTPDRRCPCPTDVRRVENEGRDAETGGEMNEESGENSTAKGEEKE